jgi:hypothetical protein
MRRAADWTTRVAFDLGLSNSTLEMFSAMLRRPLVQDGIITRQTERLRLLF